MLHQSLVNLVDFAAIEGLVCLLNFLELLDEPRNRNGSSVFDFELGPLLEHRLVIGGEGIWVRERVLARLVIHSLLGIAVGLILVGCALWLAPVSKPLLVQARAGIRLYHSVILHSKTGRSVALRLLCLIDHASCRVLALLLLVPEHGMLITLVLVILWTQSDFVDLITY